MQDILECSFLAAENSIVSLIDTLSYVYGSRFDGQLKKKYISQFSVRIS